MARGTNCTTTWGTVAVLEAGECQAEVIEPMIEWLPSDGNAELAHVGEVGRANPAWGMRLSEDDSLFETMHGARSSNAPLQRSTHAWAHLGVATAHLREGVVGLAACCRR